jgi:DAK2 domain fusion protein YloV
VTIHTLDGRRFAQMVLVGAQHLSNNAKAVDALNVFPVPDGDTGTNMNLSMTSGAKEVNNCVSDHIGKVAGALAKGLLMGARGNSGVILSQLFRGFAKAIETKAAISSSEFAEALEAGVATAYKAVMKPVEGTILTVAKDAAKCAVAVAKKQPDLAAVMEEVVKEAKASLQRTPDLLPVLKEVGVVDSGGQGLVYVYEGFLAELRGEALEGLKIETVSMQELVKAEHHKSAQSHIHADEIEFGYCTEFMVRFEQEKLRQHPFSEETFRQDLSRFGDSLLVVADDELVKVHIHAEHPGEVLTYGQRYGSLINIKIENMREQHANIVNEPNQEVSNASKQKQPYGIVTIAMGDGITELFKSIGAHAVIEGGQTMNPSTEDIVKAIETVHAEMVFVLPNNKNIIMAAEQAASVADNRVIVIPSKTVPQGMSAMLAFNPSATAEQNEKAMNAALSRVKTGQVTFAVRDTTIDGVEIAKDDYMGIADGKIVVSDKQKLRVAKALIEQMLDDESEIVTILYGEDASEEEVDEIARHIEEVRPDVEVEVHNGKQPLYPFIFSVE